MKNKLSWKVGLIALPFLVLIGWILSGLFKGGGNDVGVKTGGFNTLLPAAKVALDSAKDKMSFYAVATADSVKRNEQLQMDPYRARPKAVDAVNEYVDEAPVVRVREKIKAIRRQVIVPVEREYPEVVPEPPVYVAPKPDPEMEAINATLEKIAALQQPAVKTKVADVVQAKKVYEVAGGEPVEATYFGRRYASGNGAFYGDANASKTTMITAVIPVGQVVQAGSTVRLELLSTVTINSVVVPAGTVVSGMASIDAERLMIRIPTINSGNQLLPVALSVFDLDGLEGIYVPGSISREAAKQAADGAVQSVGINGLDASVKTQALSAGIGAAKGLFSRRVRAVRVTLNAGYKVLLRDNNQRN